jgi:hypothetical protein
VGEARLRRAREHLAPGVEEPIHEAVSRLRRRGREGHLHPCLREHLPVLPAAAPQRQVAEPRLVPGADPHPPAPVAASAHRLHARAVQLHPRVLVAVPAPGPRGADRVHDRLPQHLGQGPTPDVEGGEREHVDPDVVVLVHGARLVALADHVLREVAFRAIGPVRLAPQRPLPVARLPQQVVPRDPGVVLRAELLDGDVLPDKAAHVLDEAAVVGHADHRREEALRDAEGHVHPSRIAPLRDEVPVADDEPGGGTSLRERPDGIVVRLPARAERVLEGEIARRARLARDREVDRFAQAPAVQAGAFRGPALPRVMRTGVVDGGGRGGHHCLRQREERGQDHEPSPSERAHVHLPDRYLGQRDPNAGRSAIESPRELDGTDGRRTGSHRGGDSG